MQTQQTTRCQLWSVTWLHKTFKGLCAQMHTLSEQHKPVISSLLLSNSLQSELG